MGRVTRIMKAAADPQTKNAANGPEKQVGDRDLPRVIAAWSRLPEHHKHTVMTLVELVEKKRGK